MYGPKFLLYSAALVVTVWGVNGVATYQPEKPDTSGSVLTPQNSSLTSQGEEIPTPAIAYSTRNSAGR